ncbi:hypothetical protein CDL15_Pgr024282 [Punica granatum]|uniref:Uncharacterized protein n=1 Tax=Punica granatum TaxID=22663 RepID=A0A218XX61_PUNGR|nr:hypothetical protein CDL15_Pgr024282 [Punica granatum]
MAVSRVPSLQFGARVLLRTDSVPLNLAIPIVKHQKSYSVRPTVAEAKANPWTESAKIRNRRNRKKFTGTPTIPRLSVFCSDKQLYAMLVDDQNKKCLFYGSTLQKSIRGDPPCGTIVRNHHCPTREIRNFRIYKGKGNDSLFLCGVRSNSASCTCSLRKRLDVSGKSSSKRAWTSTSMKYRLTI